MWERDALVYATHTRPALGARPLAELDVEDLVDWQDGLEEAGVGPLTLIKAMSIFAEAAKRPWSSGAWNPVCLLQSRPAEQDVLLINLMEMTGCQPGEALGLRWSDIHPLGADARLRHEPAAPRPRFSRSRRPGSWSGPSRGMAATGPTIRVMATPLTTRSEWLAAHPPPASRLSETLAGIADRVRRGEDFQHAAREFLDEFSLRGDARSRAEAIAERPELTGQTRYDAYLAALAEHLAAVHGLERPTWSIEPERFLDRFWFVSDTPGFRAVSIAQAPAAFRRRGVFVPERSLHRI
jgi:hypothetical protein